MHQYYANSSWHWGHLAQISWTICYISHNRPKLLQSEQIVRIIWTFQIQIAPSGGRRENFGGISCEKSRFYAKKSYFFQLRREARKMLGYFVWKITILRQKINIFSNFRGAPPPWIRPWDLYISLCQSVALFLLMYMQFFILSLHWKYTICILVNIIRETNPISLCYK